MLKTLEPRLVKRSLYVLTHLRSPTLITCRPRRKHEDKVFLKHGRVLLCQLIIYEESFWSDCVFICLASFKNVEYERKCKFDECFMAVRGLAML